MTKTVQERRGAVPVWLLPCLALCACATAGGGRAEAEGHQAPVKRVVGQPVKLDILGASYTFPARFELPHHDDKPGVFFLLSVDRITACEVALNFETLTNGKQLTKYGDEVMTKKDQELIAKGLETKVVPDSFTVLRQEGRLLKRVTRSRTDPEDHFSSWRFETFIPEQTLALHGYVECRDDALLSKTLEVLVSTLNTQTPTS